MRRWVLDKEGVPRPEVLAAVTLVVVFTVLLGRTLMIELRPHIDPEDGRTRAQLEDQAEFAIGHIMRHVRGAGRARVVEGGSELKIYHGKMDAEMEPRDVSKDPIHFFVSEDRDLMAEHGGETRVLARDISHVEFHPLYGQFIGMSLHAQADGELLEIRERLCLRYPHAPHPEER